MTVNYTPRRLRGGVKISDFGGVEYRGRKQGDIIYYTSHGIEHARYAYNVSDYGKFPPTNPAPGGYINQRQQQEIIGQIRGGIIRNFHRIAQTTEDRPNWRWNAGFSKRLWLPPYENPEPLTPPLFFKRLQPQRN